MTTDLLPPDGRDDGKPWVSWTSGSEYAHVLPGHRERVSVTAWYDAERQSLVLTLEQFDESMCKFMPCWAQLALVDVGPFMARSEITAFAGMWEDTILEAWRVGLPIE